MISTELHFNPLHKEIKVRFLKTFFENSLKRFFEKFVTLKFVQSCVFDPKINVFILIV